MATMKQALAYCGLAAGMLSAAGVAAQSYPADKPELEYLAYWRLNSTLPTGSNYTNSLDIDPNGLATYTHNYFRVVTGGGVSMKAQYGGAVTSSGTAFSRTELREMASATAQAAWNCTGKQKEMATRVRIKSTPRNKPEMSIAQIHDAENDNLIVLYRYDPAQNGGVLPAAGTLGDKGRILIKWNDSTSQTVLDNAYVVGDVIKVVIRANGSTGNGYPGVGKMRVDYTNETRGRSSSATASFSGVAGSCYFKAGNYHQGCTRSFANGSANATCRSKSYPLSNGFTWEDPGTETNTSELILYNLTVNPKGN